MEKLKDFKRVIFYGCSFSAGEELSDHEFIEEKSIEEADKLKNKFGYHFYKEFHIDVSKLHERNLQKAWPKWCADHLALEYVNRSKQGSSMQEIIFLIERDIALRQIKDSDLIVVGLTSANRILKFDAKGNSGSLIFHEFDIRWPDEDLKKLYLKHLSNDYNLFFNWYFNIRYLDLLSKKLQGRLVQQYVWATCEEFLYITTQDEKFAKNLEFLYIMKQMFEFESILDQNLSFGKICDWKKDTHTFYHPKLEKQIDFGTSVAKLIIKRFG